jgi:hypothetical protein
VSNTAVNSTGRNKTGVAPRPTPAISGPVLLVVAGGAVSQAAITHTAKLAAGAAVTVVGVGPTEISRTDSASSRPRHPTPVTGEAPEQVRRTVALAMSVLENAGVMATGHVAVTGSPARAVARIARACGARVVILDQLAPIAGGGHHPRSGMAWSGAGRGGAGGSGAAAAGLMAELRRRMYGSGIVVLAETDRRGGWVSG